MLGCSPGCLLVPWSSRCRKDLDHLLPSPILLRQKSSSAKMDGGCCRESIEGHCPPIDLSAIRHGLQLCLEAEAVVRMTRGAWSITRERLSVGAPASGRGSIFDPPRMGTPMAMASVVPFPAAHLGSPYIRKESTNHNLLPGFLPPGAHGRWNFAHSPWRAQQPQLGHLPHQAPGRCRRDALKLLCREGAGFTQPGIHPDQRWTQTWPWHPQETGGVGDPSPGIQGGDFQGQQEVRHREAQQRPCKF